MGGAARPRLQPRLRGAPAHLLLGRSALFSSAQACRTSVRLTCVGVNFLNNIFVLLITAKDIHVETLINRIIREHVPGPCLHPAISATTTFLSQAGSWRASMQGQWRRGR